MPCSLASSAATFFAWSLAAPVSLSSASHRCTTPAPMSPPERWMRLGAHTWILPQRREVDAVVILVLDVDQPASRQRRSGHREGGRGSSQRVELVDEVEAEIELGVRLLRLGYARCHFIGKSVHLWRTSSDVGVMG